MTWEPIAHACELSKPGDYVVLPWRAGIEIAVTNVDGQLLAFANRCPHRGMRIFTDMRGNREPRCLYHGRLARAGQVELYALASVGPWLFASRSKIGLPDLDEALQGWFQSAGSDLVLHSTLRFTMECDWKVAVENALEAEHVPHVHANSLAKLKLVSDQVVGFMDGSSIQVFRAGAAKGLDAAARLFELTHPFDYAHAHCFPRACLSSTRGWTYSLQNYFPRQDGQTEFVHRLYIRPETPQWFAAGVARLNEQVFREDAAICSHVPADFPGDLGPHDGRIQHFRSRL